MNIRTQNNRSKTSAFGVVSGRQNFVKLSHLYSSGKSLKEFLGYCKYTANPDGKKLSRLVRITIWVIGLLLLNFTLWIGRNSRHHLNKLGAKLNLLSLIGHWHHLEFPFMTLHPNALYQGTIPMKKTYKGGEAIQRLSRERELSQGTTHLFNKEPWMTRSPKNGRLPHAVQEYRLHCWT